MASDIEYYRARALEERERAETAADPAIAEIHRNLAMKYEALAGEAETPTLGTSWHGDSDAQPA